jgi:adenine deaminase
VNVLQSLQNPTPEVVVCRGQVVVRDGRLLVDPPSESFPWSEAFAGAEPRIPAWGEEVFPLPRDAPSPFPAGKLVNAVITREVPVELREEGAGLWPVGEDALVMALGDRGGRWVGRGVITNLAPGLEALASTYTTNGGVLVVGRTPGAMAASLARLRELGGGMVVQTREAGVKEFPLTIAGIHMPTGFAAAAVAAQGLQQVFAGCGYPHADPNYTLLFLSCDFLPELRLTHAGWVRIKSGEVLLPSTPLAGVSTGR